MATLKTSTNAAAKFEWRFAVEIFGKAPHGEVVDGFAAPWLGESYEAASLLKDLPSQELTAVAIWEQKAHGRCLRFIDGCLCAR